MAFEDDLNSTLKIAELKSKEEIDVADLDDLYEESLFLFKENQKLRKRTNIAYAITALAITLSILF